MNNYIDATSNLTSNIVTLLNSVSLWKFLKFAFVLIIISGACYFLFENYTSYSKISKLEKKLLIIEKILIISNKDSTIAKESNKKLLAIVNNLDIENKPLNLTQINVISTILSFDILKILMNLIGSCLIPLLIVLTIDKNSIEKVKSDTIRGAWTIVLIFFVLSLLIPTIINIWINCLLIIIVQVATLLLYNKIKK